MQWLASLVGATGAKGDKGDTGAAGAKRAGELSSSAGIIGILKKAGYLALVAVGMAVNAGKILRYSDNLYRVIQPHTTQADWSPDITPALYNKITATEWEKWEPNNFYAKGAKVTHNNKKWISNVDNNHWEPGAVGVYTWDEYTG